MEQGMAEALKALQVLLAEEVSAGPSEALAQRKEAAVASLEALFKSGVGLDSDDDALAGQLRELLAANRFSLKRNGLRAQLGRLLQPKAAAPAAEPRPRLDLVH